jgi:hypothetical protein
MPASVAKASAGCSSAASKSLAITASGPPLFVLRLLAIFGPILEISVGRCPVHIKKGGKRYIVGIHNYGAASGNSATRITAAVFENLQQWSKIGIAVPLPQPVPSELGVAA